MSLRAALLWLLAMTAAVASQTAAARVELPRLFSDGAVLQRDRPLSVWGLADAGQTVHVDFNGRAAIAVAAADGRWAVQLPAQVAGGPYVLTVTAGKQARTVADVWVGDVWLASGQSNMEWPVSQSAAAEQVIASAGDAGIRHFKIPKSWSGQPQDELTGGAWQVASPQTVGTFSAAAYAFARELRAATGVPIGIIDSTWGGSRIEAWMDAAAQGLEPNVLAEQARRLHQDDERVLAETRRNLSRWPALPADDGDWQAATLDDAAWAEISVPALWETQGWAGMDGVAWYRTEFTLSAAEAAAGVVLGVGRIDDSDRTWVNGHPVGATSMQYNLPREYRVPPEALHAGSNQIAVRVADYGGGGGIHAQASELFVQPLGGARRSLAGTWRFRPAQAAVALVDDKNQVPTLLYNQMIHPLLAYPVRGVIWYQGESNATQADAWRYREQFAQLIQAWRADWQQPALPFLWVQLANFDSGADTEAGSPWALLRESQSAALALPATAQVVSIDVGNPDDIHPLDKQTIGHRLALAARRVAYGEAVQASGPVLRGVRFDGAQAVVDLDVHGSALAVRGGGELLGFELAGADRRFHPAQARTEGDRVVVTSRAVPDPQAVRYAWRDNPQTANLIDREQLPASPFRSDAW